MTKKIEPENILILLDSFKGSKSSSKLSVLLKRLLTEHIRDKKIVFYPIADGGEGTVEALTFDSDFIEKEIEVSGPYNKNIKTSYRISGKTAYLEMCSASGFIAVDSADIVSPFYATSYGTGELIKDALEDERIQDIVLGIGGSLTNDCGAGMLQALRMDFSINEKIFGKDLFRIKYIDNKNFLRDLKKKKITVLCDVDNPLFGENGATKMYARQKGATLSQIDILEEGVKSFHHLVKEITGKDMSKIPGSGASGGMGYALMTFFDTDFVNGFDYIMKKHGLIEEIKKTDHVITGEGKFDQQSFFGKSVGKIIKLCNEYNKNCIVLCGENQLNNEFGQVIEMKKYAKNKRESIEHVDVVLKRAINEVVDFLKKSEM